MDCEIIVGSEVCILGWAIY